MTDLTARPDNIAPESSGKLKTRKKNKAKEKTLQSKVALSSELEANAHGDDGSKAHVSEEATIEPMDQDPSTGAKLLDDK